MKKKEYNTISNSNSKIESQTIDKQNIHDARKLGIHTDPYKENILATITPRSAKTQCEPSDLQASWSGDPTHGGPHWRS